MVSLAWLGLLGTASAAQLNATWLGGTNNWNTAGNWSGGIVPNNGADTYNVFIDNSALTNSRVSLDTAVTINNLTVTTGDSLRFLDAQSITLAGGAASGSITNNGTITLESVGNGTGLLLPGTDGSLLGSGTLAMMTNSANQIRGVSTCTERLLNGPNHTIAGAGNIGANCMTLSNQGTISANISGATLTVDLNEGAPGAVNTGTMQASNGGILQLYTGTFTNTGGTIQALTGSRVALDGGVTIVGGRTIAQAGSTVDVTSATLTGGVSTVQLGGSLRVGPSGVLTLSNAGVTNAGVFEVNDNSAVYLAGALTNTGSIFLKSAGNGTYLLLPGVDGSLLGNGTLTLMTNSANIVRGNNTCTERLLNGPSHTIAGAGQIGQNCLTLSNQGTISANISGATLTVDLNEGAPGAVNTGTMQASNGGLLQLYTGTFTNTGGTIQALVGSRVTLNAGMRIVGGSVLAQNGGTVEIGSFDNSTLDSLSLTNTGTFQVLDGGVLFVAGTITNNATIMLKSTGNATDLRLTGDATLRGGGTLLMQTNINNRIDGNTCTEHLTNALGHTIAGGGQIGANCIVLINQGMVDANIGSATLTIDPNEGLGPVINTGTIQASNGGILQLCSGTFTNTGGMIQALAGSRLALDCSVTLVGGSILIQGTATATVSSATIQGGTETIAPTGVVQVSSFSVLTLNNAGVTNAGVIEVVDGGLIFATGTITNTGSIVLKSVGDSTDLRLNGADVTLAGPGTLTMLTNVNNRIYGAVLTTERLINGAGHTIAGGGQVGVNQMGLNNQGLIDANIGGATLTVDPTDSLIVTNSGFLRASGGGTLLLEFGTYTSSGSVEARTNGTVTVNPSTTWLNYSSGILSGGTWRALATNVVTTLDIGPSRPITNNAAVVELGGPGSVFSQFDTVQTNQGTFRLSSGRVFGTQTNLTNSGTLDVNGSGTSLTVTGTLANTGTVLVNNSAALRATLGWTNSGTVTLQAGVLNGAAIRNANLLQGNGTINPALTNAAGAIVRATNGELRVVGKVGGPGAFAAVAGSSPATLTFGAGGGSISALFNTGATIRVEGSLTHTASFINQGTLTIAGGTLNIFGALTAGDGASTTGTVWVTGSGLLVTNGVTTLGNSGVGLMTISNGIVRGSTVVAGIQSGGTGTLRVFGGTNIVLSSLTMGDCILGGVGTVTVSGGNLYVTNATHTAVLDVRSGTLALGGGSLVVDTLVMTNSCGHFVRTGGTLVYGSAVLDPNLSAIGDGIPNGWKQQYGLDPFDPNLGSEDPDGDGFTNLQEFLAGSNPVADIKAITNEGNNIRVTWQAAATKTNALQSSPGSSGSYSNNFADIFIVTNNVGSVTNFLDVGAATNTPARYYRVRLAP
jgi:hypothetical protein